MKIICIGRNYGEHAKELKNEVPTEPIFFCKPDSAILPKGNPFFIPEWSNDIHFEVELIYRIEKLGKNIDRKFAPRYYSSVGLGIDFTARDVQSELKAKGLPWEKAKGFDGSAVLSEEFLPLSSFPDPGNIAFSLHKNGQLVQSGNSSDMIFSIDHIIEYVSKYMMLKIGDLIYTGTPSGVGPVSIGDELEGRIGERVMFKTKIR
jgi:acylpyruvate hydrolase